MTKWKSLAGKFTAEEIELFKLFQKKLELNENQFVRKSVELMLFYFGNMFKIAESNVDKEITKEYLKIQKEISKYPELQLKFNHFLKKCWVIMIIQ